MGRNWIRAKVEQAASEGNELPITEMVQAMDGKRPGQKCYWGDLTVS